MSIALLREVIVRGVLEAHWSQILSACALLVMAALLVVRSLTSFSGIDPESMLFSIRIKYFPQMNHLNFTDNFTNLDAHANASIMAEGDGRLDVKTKAVKIKYCCFPSKVPLLQQ